MFLRLLYLTILGVLVTLPAIAQTVTPDNTVGTQATSTAGSFTITGGTQRLNSLFHSFTEFSPGTSSVTFFLDGTQSSVDLVIARVTGGDRSWIDSQLSLTGGNNPDLFLINPNGIDFGPGASLSLPGAFLASTAESVLFDGGLAFSAKTSSPAPLLRVSTPSGLQFGDTANTISSEGSNLAINPGQVLSFFGGDLTFSGSSLTTEGGRLNLGSVAAHSQVDFKPGLSKPDGDIDYGGVTAFQDITLTETTIADVSGDGGGRFQIQGRVFQLLDDSIVDATNYGATDAGIVSLQASERIELSGVETSIYVNVEGSGRGNHLRIETDQLIMKPSAWIVADTFGLGDGGGMTILAKDIVLSGSPDANDVQTLIGSGAFDDGQAGDATITAERLIADGNVIIAVDTGGFGPNAGAAGNLDISVNQLSLTNGVQIAVTTFGDGDGGNLDIRATESVEVSGTIPYETDVASSGIFASAEPDSTGNAGNLSIVTPLLQVTKGGKVAVNTLGEGNGGNLAIRAQEIEVADPVIDFVGAVSGVVANVVAGSSGNGGRLAIETQQLTVTNGGQITASTDGLGHAGSIDIRANEINLSGQSSDGLFRSAITSSSTTAFDAGSINLSSDSINILEGGDISVSSLAEGDSGNINLTAQRLVLSNGIIEARDNAGAQGNLNIDVSHSLLMRHGSQITTNATGTATGGNIIMNSPFLVGLENSDITANAVFGNGGNIAITTQGILGFEFGEQLTPGSDITASSEFGVRGTLEINNLNSRTNPEPAELPNRVTNSNEQIAQSCMDSDDNQFIVSGRGGTPRGPSSVLTPTELWHDPRLVLPDADPSRFNQRAHGHRIVESNTWHLTPKGQVQLLAIDTAPLQPFPRHANCPNSALAAQS